MWTQYESVLNESLTKQSNGERLDSDPFLVGKLFDVTQRDYRRAQAKYSEEMSRLFRELVLTDGRRIDSVKTVLVDYYLAEKAKAVNRVKVRA